VPYTTITTDALPAAAADLRSQLWDAYGTSAKFSALIMHPDLESGGLLSKAQAAELRDFQKRSGARALKFATDPAAVGMTAAPCSRGDGSEAMRFTTSTPFGVSGVKADAVLGFSGIQRWAGVAIHHVTLHWLT
jgi:hypothetical protein